MNSKPKLSAIDKIRKALLLAGAGAMLHNLGKISSKFIKKHIRKEENTYLYQHVLQLIEPHCSSVLFGLWKKCANLSDSDILEQATKDALTTNQFSLLHPFDDRPYCPGDLLEYLGVNEPWYKPQKNRKGIDCNNGKTYGIECIFPDGSRLTHLMNLCHGFASGGEKDDIYKLQQKDPCDLSLATPFGWERPALNASDIDGHRTNVEKIIQSFFNPIITPFPFQKFSTSLRPLLEKAIADTQRPVNDVTIWDMGCTGSALLITQALTHILHQKSTDHAQLAKGNLCWRILSIRTNGLLYLEEAATIADLRVRSRLMKKALDKIRCYLEGLPLVFEIYRDENGSLFIYPDMDETEPLYQGIKGHIIKFFEPVAIMPEVELSESLTGKIDEETGIYMGRYISKKIRRPPEFIQNSAEIISRAWSDGNVKEICQACGMRPQGSGADEIDEYKHNKPYYSQKAESRNICCICMDRRRGVAEKWVKNLEGPTVWVDEVADENGRIALVAGRLPVVSYAENIQYPSNSKSTKSTKWHHKPKFIDPNSLPEEDHAFEIKGKKYSWNKRNQDIVGEEKLTRFKNAFLKTSEPREAKFNIEDLKIDENGNLTIQVQEDLTEKFSDTTVIKCLGEDFEIIEKNLVRPGNPQAKERFIRVVCWGNQHPFIIESSKSKEDLKVTGGVENKSFARLRRLWETTKGFWKEIQEGGLKATVDKAQKRLEIKGERSSYDPEDNNRPGKYHAYELLLKRGIKLNVVWDPENSRFITADNLKYLARLLDEESVQKSLQGNVKILEPTGYGSQDKEWGTIEIREVKKIDASEYVPAIPILADPESFMALVPARNALDVANLIREKYEREMGKVRNRLPLHLGIVFSHHRTPLRAVLDAGRRLMSIKTDSKVKWNIEVVEKVAKAALPPAAVHLSASNGHYDECYAIKLAGKAGNFTWHVPVYMGDGDTEDQWYPYVHLIKAFNGNANDTRKRRMGDLVHVGDLKTGDEIKFAPSTFDWIWLDSSARRFEIAYDDKDGTRVDKKMKRRPYLLDDLAVLQEEIWATLEKHLTTNQIYALRDIIEAKRELWQPVPEDGIALAESTFRQFCRSVLSNVEWSRGIPWGDDDQKDHWLNRWASFADRGWVNDAVELYMQVLKKKPNDKKEKNI